MVEYHRFALSRACMAAPLLAGGKDTGAVQAFADHRDAESTMMDATRSPAGRQVSAGLRTADEDRASYAHPHNKAKYPEAPAANP